MSNVYNGKDFPINVNDCNWGIYHAVIDNQDNIITVFINDGSQMNIDARNLVNGTNMRRIPSSVSKRLIDGITQMVDNDFKFATDAANINGGINDNRSIIENRFTLPKEMFEAVDFTNMGIIEEPKNLVPTFVKGEKYALRGVSCEGFEMPEKVYELVTVHDKFYGVNINSIIVKQISGEQDKIFTLSKNDCEHIGIEYENGLQLFPKHLNWERVKDIIPFNPSDLSTTPLSDIDNTIRYIVLKLNGFKDYVDGYIITPSGKLIKEKQFEKTLRIVSNEPIVYGKSIGEKGNNHVIQEGVALNTKIVYPKVLKYNHGNFISSEDTVYVMIDLTRPYGNAMNGFYETSDHNYGITRELVSGFNPNDHFFVSWDELGAYTVEEYEAEKERKEKERLERIAKEEEQKKKRIAEEEKRIKEQRRRTEEAINRMRMHNIKLPQFPKMVDFNMDSGLSSLNLYVDGLNLYFDSLDNSLTKLSKDLSNMSRTIGVDLDKRLNRDMTNSTLLDLFKL